MANQICVVFILVLFLLEGSVDSFTPLEGCLLSRFSRRLQDSGHVQAKQSSTSSRYYLTTLHVSEDSDSEWYSPPPSHKKTIAMKLPKGVVPNIPEIRSNNDLLEFLKEDDRLCVVKFYASWCKSCQKFNVHYDQLAKEKSDWRNGETGEIIKQNQVRMASVEHSKAKMLCDSLGLERLPTVFLYHKGRKLTEISVGASKFSQVRDAVEQYSTFSTQDKDFAVQMEEGKQLIKTHVLETTTTAPPPSAPVPEQTIKETTTTDEERQAKIEALLSRSAARSISSKKNKKWWTHQTK